MNACFASGGGDGPEAVTAGLYEALHMEWRKEATKICVLIADAPPHGLEPTGDGFPNGDPDGRDPLQICREMAANSIVCYSVGCEPALGSYRFARDFMVSVAEITGGQAIALGSAALLAQVIMGSATEELDLQKIMRTVDEEVQALGASDSRYKEYSLGHLDEKSDAYAAVEAEVTSRVHEKMSKMNIQTKQMKTSNMTSSLSNHFRKAETLASCKIALSSEIKKESVKIEKDSEYREKISAPPAPSRSSPSIRVVETAKAIWTRSSSRNSSTPSRRRPGPEVRHEDA